MRNKVELIKDYILEEDIDICALTETWLSEHDQPIVGDLQPDGYKLLHVDRKNRTGGGVAVLCKSSTQPVISSKSSFTSFECINVKMRLHETVVNLAVIYRPPSLPQVHEYVF